MPPRPRPPSLAKRYRPQEVPLLNPAPNDNLPAQCRKVGMRIGDVGVWRDDGSSLEVLFNACLPVDDPLHEQLGVPQGFVPFVLEKKAMVKTRYHSPGTVISTGRKWKASLDAGASSIIPQ
uniref:Uncharacterized protein n=1 Tax=Mycena chlorophos TaxID=658473 RepID=A0ABQ0LY96_MYCCL|nr:predicted protein [Mycena chlorophos]